MTEPNKCACGHAAFGHDDGRGECFTSGCKCRTLTEPTDLDALIASAESMTPGEIHDHPMAALDKLRALSRELRQERERADENADAARGQNDLNREMGADLSRAEETIEKAKLHSHDHGSPTYRILAEYGEQKANLHDLDDVIEEFGIDLNEEVSDD